MDDGFELRLTGDTDIREAMQELKDVTLPQLLRQAVKSAAAMLLSFLVSAEPFDTGRLQRNTLIRLRSAKSTVRGRVVVRTDGNRYSDENAFYWRFLEKGFHTRRGDFRRYPFAAAVLDGHSREAAQKVYDATEEAIDKATVRANGAG